MTTIRYARVQSTINDDNSDENVNQLESIDSEEEEEALPSVKISSADDEEEGPSYKYTRSVQRISIFTTALLILCYFVLSIGLTFYQRWLLKGYKFPFSVVIYHLFVKLVMSTIIRIVYRICTGKNRVKLPVATAIRKVAPTSFFGAVDIGFSQWGLEFVDVALYTMTKSTVIIFISFFAVLFRLEKKSWSLLFIVVMISSGLFMFTFKSTEFNLLGFVLLIIASFSSGARWTLAQILMQRSKLGLHNPIDMIFYMQPYMLISLLPFAIIFESGRLLMHFDQFLELEWYEVMVLWLKISVGAFLAFFLEISEFLVLSQTSSMTLSVSGIFKEICQLVLAIEISGEQLSLYNLIGLILCLGGITAHVIYKYWTLTENLPERDSHIKSECQYDMKNQYSTKFDKTKPALNIGGPNEGKFTNTNGTNVVIAYNAGNQKSPLLNYDSESDEDENDMDSRSAEILFDILKRRDETRD